MNRLSVEEVADSRGNNNLTDNKIMKDNGKPKNTAIGSHETAISVTDVELISSNPPKPNDLNGFVNSDDVNLMKKRTVGGVVLNEDGPDSRPRSNKPPNYAAKKTIAQGMMDIALLTSNANQLRNVVTYEKNTVTFWFITFLISFSLILQVSVGISLIFKGRFDTKGKDKAAAARVNKWIMSAVFLITIINIFIAVFSSGPLPDSNSAGGQGNNSAVRN